MTDNNTHAPNAEQAELQECAAVLAEREAAAELEVRAELNLTEEINKEG